MNAFKLTLAVFGMLMSGMMNTVEAASAPSTGIIRFQGMIVEDGCEVVNQGQNLQSSCYRNGKTLTASHSVASTAASPKSLPQNLGTTHMRWLDDSRKAGILTVSYN